MDPTVTTAGSFACSGTLVVCDTVPHPSLAAADMAGDGSQCLHLSVRPGRFRVDYVAGEDGPDDIPREVWLVHESAAGPPARPARRLTLQVEGGRIAVIDHARISDRAICGDLEYEAADHIQHDCGLVISTWGDGDYPVLFDAEPATVVVLVLEE